MKVVIAMSGGVDSSVAAHELKKQGLEVIGMTMKTWPKQDCGAHGEKFCCSLESVQFAKSVAEDVGIPHHVIDLSLEFSNEIKSYFADEYSKGRTPSPCIPCNRLMKFGYLFDAARELGAEKIATGHFARIIEKDGAYLLAEGVDKKKDQSYFLSGLTRGMLSDILFPLGGYTKEEVRNIARRADLMPAERPSSQDICFGAVDEDYRSYLLRTKKGSFQEGDILDTSGNVVGRHKGISSYTVGQRHGIGVTLPGGPIYVTKIDPESNTIVVGSRDMVMKKKVKVSGFNWLSIDSLEGALECEAKLRYLGKKGKAKVVSYGEDEAVIEFTEEQFAPTPGQAAVFYDGEIVIGSAWIDEALD